MTSTGAGRCARSPVKGRRAITADTDLRLCRYFGLSEGFWLRMQASHDLKLAKQALESVLPAIEPLQQP